MVFVQFSICFYIDFVRFSTGGPRGGMCKNISKRSKAKRGACMFSLRARTRETWIKFHIGLSLYRLCEIKQVRVFISVWSLDA